MKNGDSIRAMTDKELAELFWIRADCELCPNKEPYCSDDCKKHWLDWLKQEAVDNGACFANETSEKVQEDE